MIGGATQVVAVLGDPIAHTRSPAMLNAAFAAEGIDMVMVPMHVAPAALAAAVRGLAAQGVRGASVTVPHKTAILAACDRLAPSAREIGAVNCLVIADGAIEGDNTDAPGFVAGLDEALGDGWARGRRAVILGAGGAARAVAWGLQEAGAGVTVVARRPPEAAFGDRVVAWDALASELATAELIVDATPVSLDAGDAESSFVDAFPLDALRRDAVVASLVYHREPLLLARARAGGHRVIDGKGMLVHQAALAFTRWVGRPAPVDVMRAALDASL